MGTNFYWYAEVCAHCGRGDEPIHIGKSSAGWAFSLHVDPELGLNDLPDWENRWQSGVIKDEYGDVISPEAMRRTIAERSWVRAAGSRLPFGALPGPNGLARHQIDGTFCVGHGAGTWDLITGVFS